MRTSVILVSVLSLALVSAMARADQGTTAAAFLQLDTSPRVIGMGDSFAGLADDVNDVEYNPAGSAFLTQKEVTVMDAMWIQGINYGYGALDWPFSFGTLSADLFYLNAGTFQGTALQGNTVVNTSTFTAADMYGTLAYGRKILPYLSAGVSVKFLNEQIAAYSASTAAASLSLFYRSPIPGLGAGLVVSNLGPDEGFQQGFPLPANIRMGVGYKVTQDISVDSDYTQYFNTAGTWSIGGEYGYRILVFRAGYKYQGAVDYNQVEQGYGPAAAAGLDLGLGIRLFKNYSADYSYSPMGFLGSSQMLSLSAKFD